MYGIIYCAICIQNGKIYIGKTTQGIGTRKIKEDKDRYTLKKLKIK